MLISNIINERNVQYKQLLEAYMRIEQKLNEQLKVMSKEIRGLEKRYNTEIDMAYARLKSDLAKLGSSPDKAVINLERQINDAVNADKKQNEEINKRFLEAKKAIEKAHKERLNNIEGVYSFDNKRNEERRSEAIYVCKVAYSVDTHLLAGENSPRDIVSKEDRLAKIEADYRAAKEMIHREYTHKIEEENRLFNKALNECIAEKESKVEAVSENSVSLGELHGELDRLNAKIEENLKQEKKSLEEEANLKIARLEEEKIQSLSKLYAQREKMRKELERTRDEHSANIERFLSDVEKELDEIPSLSSCYLLKKNADYSNINKLPEKLCIGQYFSPVESNELTVKLYGQKIIAEPHSVELDVRNNGNIIIRANKKDENNNALYRIVGGIVLKYLQEFPAGSLKIHIVDKNNDNMYFLKMKNVLKEFVTKSTDARDAIEQARCDCESLSEYLIGDIEDIYDFYNVDQSDVAKMNLVVIKSGFDKMAENPSILQEIRNLTGDTARKVGVRFIIVDDADEEKQNSECEYLLNEIRKNATSFDFADDSVSIDGCEFDITRITEQRGEKFTEEQCMNVVDALNKKNNIVTYEDIGFGNEKYADAYGGTLTIPVGKCGSSIYEVSFSCGAEGAESDSIHYLVAGTAGGGKSSLFHNIIMNGAMKYSPRDLQFWLLDFKSGGASSYYENAELPHIGMLSKKNAPEDAEALLRLLATERKRRQEHIKAAGQKYCGTPFSQVNHYNKFVDEHPELAEEHIPRILVMIDEAHLMFMNNSDDASASESGDDESIMNETFKKNSERLGSIARLSRSVGIHFVLVVQNLIGIESRLTQFMSQCKGKVAFGVDDDALASLGFGYTFNDTAKNGKIQTFTKGLCYASCDNDVPKRVQMAFCNMKTPEQAQKYFSKIRETYPETDFPVNTAVIGNMDMLLPDTQVKGTDYTYEELIKQPVITYNDMTKKHTLEIAIGEDFYLTKPAILNLNRRNGNVCILGSNGASNYIGASLCTTLLKAFSSLEAGEKDIYVCNGYGIDGIFDKAIAELADDCDVHSYTTNQIDLLVKEIYDEFLRRKDAEGNGDFEERNPIFAIISGMEGIEKIEMNAPLATSAPQINDTKVLENDLLAKLQKINQAAKNSLGASSAPMIQQAIMRLCVEGCKYNIFFNFAASEIIEGRAGEMMSECVQKSFNVIAFNAFAPRGKCSNVNHFAIKNMLSKIKASEGSDETLVIKVSDDNIYRIRPVIYG